MCFKISAKATEHWAQEHAHRRYVTVYKQVSCRHASGWKSSVQGHYWRGGQEHEVAGPYEIARAAYSGIYVYLNRPCPSSEMPAYRLIALRVKPEDLLFVNKYSTIATFRKAKFPKPRHDWKTKRIDGRLRWVREDRP